ncbi:MAG: hypothetical protein AAGI63_04635 [Planctomycetota bacterium]
MNRIATANRYIGAVVAKVVTGVTATSVGDDARLFFNQMASTLFNRRTTKRLS